VKKKVTAEDLAASAWAAALLGATVAPDVVPPGWFTVRGLALKLKTPVPTIQGKMQRLFAAGKAERRNYRVQLEKNVRPVPHYRLK
jgi:hypothetical protein